MKEVILLIISGRSVLADSINTIPWLLQGTIIQLVLLAFPATNQKMLLMYLNSF